MDHDESSLLHSSVWHVAVTAISLGVVHVLSGPDHLGALVALSNGKTWPEAFCLGAQWGFGHSVGIVCVALVCIFVIGHTIAPNGAFVAACKYLTGVCLILLGAWTLYSAVKEYNAAIAPRSPKISASSPTSQWSQVQCQDASYVLLESEAPTSKVQRTVNSVASVCVGIIHGAAGPGWLLAMLPTLAMHDDVMRALVYLGCFCVSSVLAMGTFAALYGELTQHGGRARSPKAGLYVGMGSALLSVSVGAAWIALQATGWLDRVFGD